MLKGLGIDQTKIYRNIVKKRVKATSINLVFIEELEEDKAMEQHFVEAQIVYDIREENFVEAKIQQSIEV
jgi:hypothetical protein